jgi:hypothetical protein
MAKKLIQFFATKEDVLLIAEWVESRRQLKYAPTGLFAEERVENYEHISEFPNLGVATSENAINCDCYAAIDRSREIKVRRILQNSGEVRYAVDQLENPQSVAFQPGGFWSSEIMLYGRVGCASDDGVGVEIFKLFSAAIRNQFIRTKAFYVGPRAHKCATLGCRLAIGADSPPGFDLIVS